MDNKEIENLHYLLITNILKSDFLMVDFILNKIDKKIIKDYKRPQYLSIQGDEKISPIAACISRGKYNENDYKIMDALISAGFNIIEKNDKKNENNLGLFLSISNDKQMLEKLLKHIPVRLEDLFSVTEELSQETLEILLKYTDQSIIMSKSNGYEHNLINIVILSNGNLDSKIKMIDFLSKMGVTIENVNVYGLNNLSLAIKKNELDLADYLIERHMQNLNYSIVKDKISIIALLSQLFLNNNEVQSYLKNYVLKEAKQELLNSTKTKSISTTKVKL